MAAEPATGAAAERLQALLNKHCGKLRGQPLTWGIAQTPGSSLVSRVVHAALQDAVRAGIVVERDVPQQSEMQPVLYCAPVYVPVHDVVISAVSSALHVHADGAITCREATQDDYTDLAGILNAATPEVLRKQIPASCAVPRVMLSRLRLAFHVLETYQPSQDALDRYKQHRIGAQVLRGDGRWGPSPPLAGQQLLA